jgi:hypothetical protein
VGVVLVSGLHRTRESLVRRQVDLHPATRSTRGG